MKSSTLLILATAAGQLLLACATFACAAQPREPRHARPDAAASAAVPVATPRKPGVAPLDINSAAKAELMTLPGLKAADAQRVIAGRPYFSKAQLVTRKVISDSQYDAIKSSIMARQKGLSRSARTGKQ